MKTEGEPYEEREDPGRIEIFQKKNPSIRKLSVFVYNLTLLEQLLMPQTICCTL